MLLPCNTTTSLDPGEEKFIHVECDHTAQQKAVHSSQFIGLVR